MPLPANIALQPGAVEINSKFSIAVSGPGASDPRLQYEAKRTFERLSRQTGIPVLPHILNDSSEAILAIVVRNRDHKPPQKLGDDERYSLTASAGQIKITSDAPLGALRGIETFLQLVQQNTTRNGGAAASPGFSVPAVTIQDQPRFPWRGLSLDVSRHFIPVQNVKRPWTVWRP